MTKKIRLTRTMVVEYVPNPSSYPEGYVIEQMAKMDAESDDRDLLFDFMDLKSDDIVYEIVCDKDEEIKELKEIILQLRQDLENTKR